MPGPPDTTRRSSRKPVPKKRLAESDDDDDTSIDTPPSKTKTTSTKRKSNDDDNNNPPKSAKTTTTTTTHTSKTTEAEKVKNKALFNKFNSSMSVVNKVGDVGYEFNKLFEDGELYTGFVIKIRDGAAGGRDRRCVYDKVREILDGESTEHGTRTPASEIKVCIMCCMFVLYLHNMLAVLVLTHTLYPPVSRISQVAILTFQSTPPGIPPSEIVAARPQSNNESNEFVKSMESSVALALQSLEVKPKVFVSFGVDGVSCESRHVWDSICSFLSCLSNHIGSTDTNHNMKSWRYQIIAGADIQGCTIGKLMIDAYSLRQSVSSEIYCPSDFASDRLVLQLCSNDTIVKLFQAEIAFGSTSKGDKGAMGLTLFFMRLHLYAVNGSGVPARHRAVYLWCSMLWLTSICGACIITKRNVVSETIAFMFIVLRSDVFKPRHLTSEPAEHIFGMMRQIIREFTCLEFAQLSDKIARRLKLMYKHFFKPSRDPEKGYSATFADFYDYTRYGVNDGESMCVD